MKGNLSLRMETEVVTTLKTVQNVCLRTQHLSLSSSLQEKEQPGRNSDTKAGSDVNPPPPGAAQGQAGPTFLDAVLQVVDDGSQDGGKAHDLGALGQAEGEELVPAGPHQAGVAVLPGDTRKQAGCGAAAPASRHRTPRPESRRQGVCQRPLEGSGLLSHDCALKAL